VVSRTHPSAANCAPIAPGDGVGAELQFDHIQPCPLQVGMAASFDSTKLSEGAHRVKVVLRDASGNALSVFDKSVTVDNVPPPAVNIAPSIAGATPAGGLRPGDTLVSSDGTWTGAGITFTHRWQRQNDAGAWVDIPGATGAKYTVVTDDVGHALRVTVTATNAEGSTSATTDATAAVRSGATVQTQSVAPGTPTSTPVVPAPVAAAAGNGAGGDTATGNLVLDREQKSVDVKYAAKVVITGRLVDAQNQPIANAKVDVFEQVVTTTASWNKIATITTDSQGGYLFRPKTTASRRLRFAWADKVGTADYRATREVLVSVTAGMSIKAKHRVVGRHDTIRLNGRVSIDGLPTTGAWVEVQVLDSGVWRTVATRRLSSKGGWSFRHRLENSAKITFAFRSRLRATGEIAAAESKSVPVKVKVR
ncbi:MAG: hypothetical protein REI11_20585, partial [Patulibacter sp.]|nr:hypothetical protein [Patulibacter sp.]